jgi:gluconokinase
MTSPYVGIDIGTTATKAVAFAPNGHVLYQCSRDYPMHHPQPNWSIQKTSDILHAVQECIAELEQQFEALAFISFSAAMHSLMLIDESGTPLTDCLLWADNRSIQEAESLRSNELGRYIYQKTGIPIHSFSPLTKLLWFKKHEPCLFQCAYKFISAKEYVWHALTGAYQVDSSMASGTGLMNLKSLQWDTEILDLLGLRLDQLSSIVSPDYHCPGKHDQNTYVIGAGDGPLASLGTGAMAPHKMALTIGTSGAIRLPVSAPALDPEMRTQCYHLIGEQYLSLGAVNNGAVVLQWLKEKVLRTESSYEALFEQAQKVPAGAEGLLFIPYLLGERAPIWDATARGSLIGLSIQHQQEHLVRAALEGIVFGLRHIAEYLLYPSTERSKIEIRASGGFAKSELWLQIVADIFQMRVAVAQTVEGSAWGAVLIGCGGLGLSYAEEAGEEVVFEPNPAHDAIYAANFQRFKKIYSVLNEV